jgi:cytochrome c oxidase assembly protein subunit 15
MGNSRQGIASAVKDRTASSQQVRRLPAFTVSPGGFQRIALLAVWALALTIVSGAAVRLTGSGLGCPDWPNCTRTSVVAPVQFHAWVEFGNRLINAAVTVASVGAAAAALRRRPRRRDLTWLSFGLVAGLVAEIGLGALVVYSKLAPTLVSLHFLLGLAFLAVAVVLHHRAGLPDAAVAGRPVVGRVQVRMARAMLAALAVVVTLGTVVTSTGPHGGDPKAPRFHLSLHSVAQLHGTSVEILLGITLVNLWLLVRPGAPPAVVRRGQVVLAALVAQAVVGYTQYLNGDPVALVAVHVAGASVLLIATLRFYMGLWSPVPAAPPVKEPAPAAPAAVAPVSGGA